jgi:hypothetical protein
MKNSRLIIIIGVILASLLVIALVAITINKNFFPKAGSAQTNLEKAENSVETDVPEGTFSFDRETQWPPDIPPEIPPFKYGQVKTVARTNTEIITSWNLTLENVFTDAFEKYKKDLKDNEFKISLAESAKGGSLQAKKKEWTITTTVDLESKTASCSFSKEKI